MVDTGIYFKYLGMLGLLSWQVGGLLSLEFGLRNDFFLKFWSKDAISSEQIGESLNIPHCQPHVQLLHSWLLVLHDTVKAEFGQDVSLLKASQFPGTGYLLMVPSKKMPVARCGKEKVAQPFLSNAYRLCLYSEV